jgi:hypothetical protein
MKKIIFLIIVTFIFTNITYGQELITTTSLKTTCINLASNLKQGNRNADVTILQNFLKEKGYLNVSATGFFGGQTLKAVKNFQKDNNINSTGLVGPLTRDFINKLTCVNNTSTTTETNTTATTENNTSTTNTGTTNTETTTIGTNETNTTVAIDEVLTSNNSGSLRVRTDGVISIYNDSVVVRGMITQGAKNGIVRWFEITKNPNEYKKSETKVTSNISERENNRKFEDTFTGLESGTTYYFRTCAGNVSLGQRACGGITTVKTN